MTAGYAILKSGILTGNSTYYSQGIDILTHTLDRDDCLENDFSLCHGYPSIYYLYHKIYKLTNNAQFLDASNKWLSLAMDKFSLQYNDYVQHKTNAKYFEDGSLFYGFPVFFLTLLSIENEKYGTWDKCLLL